MLPGAPPSSISSRSNTTDGLAPYFSSLKIAVTHTEVSYTPDELASPTTTTDITASRVDDLDWLTRTDPNRDYQPPVFGIRITGPGTTRMRAELKESAISHWELPYFGSWGNVVGSLAEDARSRMAIPWQRVDCYCRSPVMDVDVIIDQQSERSIVVEAMLAGSQLEQALHWWQSHHRSALVGHVLDTSEFPTHISLTRTVVGQLGDDTVTFSCQAKLSLFSCEEKPKPRTIASKTAQVFRLSH